MKRRAMAALILSLLLGGGRALAPRSEPGAAMSWYYAEFPDDTVVFHGSQSGYETLDRGRIPGNPFATALIEALGIGDRPLSDFAEMLSARTTIESSGFQSLDTNLELLSVDRPLLRSEETRYALVLIVSEYRQLSALPGAEFDAKRITDALEEAGFKVTLGLNNSLEQSRRLISSFAAKSRDADVSLVYATGHGIERDGIVRLLMPNYDRDGGDTGVEAASLTLPEISAAGQASALNLVFYAGCRNDPFAL